MGAFNCQVGAFGNNRGDDPYLPAQFKRKCNKKAHQEGGLFIIMLLG